MQSQGSSGKAQHGSPSQAPSQMVGSCITLALDLDFWYLK